MSRSVNPNSSDLQEGWMRTGDLGTIDAQGYCNIVGRIKDMVIWGGENIYPRCAGVGGFRRLPGEV